MLRMKSYEILAGADLSKGVLPVIQDPSRNNLPPGQACARIAAT